VAREELHDRVEGTVMGRFRESLTAKQVAEHHGRAVWDQ
jgi:hypothetical protein